MRTRVRDESGFTLVELLLTTVIAMVILLATLSAFDAFGTATARNDKLTEGQDQARLRMGQMTDVIRDARPAGTATSAIQLAGANDLVMSTIDWPGEGATTSAAHLVRYCVDAATRTLYFDGLKTPATGTVNPGASCPSTATGWTHSALIKNAVGNTSALPLFRYDSATASAVRTVAMDLRIDAGTSSAPKTIALRTAAFLRTFTGSAPALTVGDLYVTCNPDHTALLGLTAGFDSSGNPLTASYQTAAGVPLGSGAVTLATSAQGNITVTITNVLGLSQVLTKNTGTC